MRINLAKALDVASMTREMLAKRFGVTIREEVPGVTWECIPHSMLTLLVEIAEAERMKRAREDHPAQEPGSQ